MSSPLTPNTPDDPSPEAGEQQRVVVVTQDGMGVHPHESDEEQGRPRDLQVGAGGRVEPGDRVVGVV
ncbi:MAG: hypothetical protein WB473_09930, partial [Pedococcus sp.]